ncbi:MAG: hypothetical protein PHN53_10670, partial [Eubacteriales bacterium]|nr:hypothetical protein [Eubacteriales bacterium]
HRFGKLAQPGEPFRFHIIRQDCCHATGILSGRTLLVSSIPSGLEPGKQVTGNRLIDDILSIRTDWSVTLNMV